MFRTGDVLSVTADGKRFDTLVESTKVDANCWLILDRSRILFTRKPHTRLLTRARDGHRYAYVHLKCSLVRHIRLGMFGDFFALDTPLL